MEIKICAEGVGGFLVQSEQCSISVQARCILLLQILSPKKKNPSHPQPPQRKLQVNYRQTHKPVHKLTLSAAIIQNINKVQKKNYFWSRFGPMS